MAIIHMVGVDKICSVMAVDNEEIAMATCNLFQCINDSLTGGDRREYGKEEALVLGKTKITICICNKWTHIQLFIFNLHINPKESRTERRIALLTKTYNLLCYLFLCRCVERPENHSSLSPGDGC